MPAPEKIPAEALQKIVWEEVRQVETRTNEKRGRGPPSEDPFFSRLKLNGKFYAKVDSVKKHQFYKKTWRAYTGKTDCLNVKPTSKYSDSTIPIWRHMKGSTQEKSHLHAPNVTSYSLRLSILRNMKGPTQVRSHLPAPNVTKHLHKLGL